MQDKPFSRSEKTIIFKAARIALQDDMMFTKIAEMMDITDEELKKIKRKLEKYMEF